MSVDYIKLSFYLVSCFLFVVLLLLIAFILAPVSNDKEKETPYECGFHPFDDSRKAFNVHFYIVALLFLIFDLELIFLMPWVFNFYSLHNITNINNDYIFWNTMFFLLILTVGFIYEWKKKALDW